MGSTNIVVLVGGLLFGGGGIAALLTWRTQSRSVPRRDAIEEHRLDLAASERALAQTESTNHILAAALDFYKDECASLRLRLEECERLRDA